MDPIRNPYSPSAGAQPTELVGRHEQINAFEILLGRIARGRPQQSMIITGLRGVGKTVLLGRFREIAFRENWIAVELEASKHDESTFRSRIGASLRTVLYQLSPRDKWSDRLKAVASLLTSFSLSVDPDGNVRAGVDVKPESIWEGGSDLSIDLTEILLNVGRAAQEHKRAVVLLIDELQFLQGHQLEALISALHRVVQHGLPLTMCGAGLPQIAELAGDAKSYAERLFSFVSLGNLSPEEAKNAIRIPAAEEGVHFEEDALELIADITEGYPFFVQELGSAVWTVAEGDTVTAKDVEAARELYQAKLDGSFFRVRLDRTTDLQRAYLRAMAELGSAPAQSSEIAAKMGRTSQNVAPVRAELINMGLLYTPQHGMAAFTVPQFDQFLLRAIPVLEVPPLRKRKR